MMHVQHRGTFDHAERRAMQMPSASRSYWRDRFPALIGATTAILFAAQYARGLW